MKRLLFLLFIVSLGFSFYSCDKKKKDPIAPQVATDSVYTYALVNGETFTSSTSDLNIYHTDEPYLVFTAETGPDQNHKKISIRIDDFHYQPGDYYISDTSNTKALFSKNDSVSDVATSGMVRISVLDKSVRGTFYFSTDNYTVTDGKFAAQ